MPIAKRAVAELLGTFWLVFGGCGSAVLAAKFPEVGIGLVGVSLAFGLTVVTMAYAVGYITGGHFNPAVTLGIYASGRIKIADVIPYIVAQLIGAVLAAWLLATIAAGNGTDAVAAGLASNGYGDHSPGGYSQATAFLTEVLMTFFFLLVILGTTSEGAPGFDLSSSGLAQNGYGPWSPGGYSMMAGLIAEVVLTAGFLIVILGSTDSRAPAGFAPIAIGLALTLIHLVSIPITNTSVNPARSTGPALMVGGPAIDQLWFFWVAPIIGGLIGGLLYKLMFAGESKPDVVGDR